MTPEVIELARHPESDVTLPSIQVTKHQDGRVTVHGSGRHKIDNGGVHYRIQINLEDNTYKAVDVPALSGTTNLEPTTTRLQGDMSLLATSSYYAQVQLVTEDPVQIDLAQTTNHLSWTENADGTLSGAQGTKVCWAANPSKAGTTWSTTSCGDIGPNYYSGDSVVACNVNSSYINWDFLSPYSSTTADHSIGVQADLGAQFSYTYDYTYAGEASSMLYTDLYVNGVKEW